MAQVTTLLTRAGYRANLIDAGSFTKSHLVSAIERLINARQRMVWTIHEIDNALKSKTH